MKTRLGHFCDRLIEAGWLLAVVLIPAFFNVRTSRVFEPDKGAMLRSLALVMAAAWLIKVIERAVHWLSERLKLAEPAEDDMPHQFERGGGKSLRVTLIVLCALYAVVYLGSTMISVHPRISLMGSYQRGQGAYLTLCLIAMALLVATHLRTRSQLGRLLVAVALGSLPVTVYAVMQRVGVDPLRWGGIGPVIASTLGNTNFLAAYLVMVIPLTLTGLILLVLAARKALRFSEEAAPTERPTLQVVGYGSSLLGGLVTLGLQVYTLAITETPIAALALLAAAVPSVLLLAAVPLRNSPHNSQKRWAILGLAGILILGIILALTLISFADVSLAELPLVQLTESARSPNLTVRLIIWDGARDLFYNRPTVGDQPDRWVSLRPLLGYGPETMYITYNRVYQPELGHYEARTASPDRAHNQLLDIGVNLGWAGIVVFLLLLAASFGTTLMIVARAQGAVEAIVACGVLWAGLAYFADAQFNVPIMSTRLLFWVGLGVVAALAVRREVEVVEESHVPLPDRPLASGVALLLLPTSALATVATVGFLRGPRDAVWPGMVMAIGLLLAVASAVIRKESLRNGLLVALALALLAGAVLTMNGLLSVMMELPPELSTTRDTDAMTRFLLQQAKTFPGSIPWLTAFVGLLSVALALPNADAPSTKWNRGQLVALLAASPFYILIAVGTVVLVLNTCVHPIQADVAFKTASSYSQSGKWDMAIDLYEAAIELTPQEDFYYIFLGQAQLQQAGTAQDAARREIGLAQALETLERAHTLNPLNPDHVANLARFHRIAAGSETNPTAQVAHLRDANEYYTEGAALAPQNVTLLNEWAKLQWQSSDEDQACQTLERSLELDPEFELTQQLYGDFCPQALPDRPQNLDFEN
jgi:tetratricopeptide (TPR) repeat protein